MKILETVLRREELRDEPPVLLDIGASGRLHAAWRKIAPYSICIAFDADDRELDAAVETSGPFRRLITVNKVLAATGAAESRFYLTKSPFCSSLLEPDSESLGAWHFAPLFEVERQTTLPATDLRSVLAEHRLNRVDWFKTDSQGTDLRLFDSLDPALQRRVLAAEFEPGIIDAYRGEDKLWQLLQYMDARAFWMDHLEIRGGHRLRPELARSLRRSVEKLLPAFLKSSPGWGEVSYLNAIDETLGLREVLLLWVIATVKRQHGFALEVAHRGHEKFDDPLFVDLQGRSVASIQRFGFRFLKVAERSLARRLR